MTNFKAEDFMEPRSERWGYENFSIYHFTADYLESDLEAGMVRELMSRYVVYYNFYPHVYDDKIILDMVCDVNAEGELPGYRFVSLFMLEFRPLFSYGKKLEDRMITADDLEFFLKSAYLSVQDHIIGTSDVMPLGAYFVTPPDLGQGINDLLSEI